jgi:hypothetical protein
MNTLKEWFIEEINRLLRREREEYNDNLKNLPRDFLYLWQYYFIRARSVKITDLD